MSLSRANQAEQPVVLLVDDEPVTRAVVSLRIASLGARVIEADDGASGLDCLLKTTVNAAIIDLEMPGLDGFALLGCIRGHPRLSHLPVIVLSGKEDPQSMQDALRAGATSYLLKPLNWTAFSGHIAAVLGVQPPERIKRTLPRFDEFGT
jgi:CheY-like chemotaxis protein